MQERLSTVFVTIGIALVVLGLMVYIAVKPKTPAPTPGDPEKVYISGKGTPATLGDDRVLTGDTLYRDAKDLMEDYLKLEELMKLLSDENAIDGEAILNFKSQEEYNEFLKLAAKYGLSILGRQSRTHALRIGYDQLTDLHSGFRWTPSEL